MSLSMQRSGWVQVETANVRVFRSPEPSGGASEVPMNRLFLAFVAAIAYVPGEFFAPEKASALGVSWSVARALARLQRYLTPARGHKVLAAADSLRHPCIVVLVVDWIVAGFRHGVIG